MTFDRLVPWDDGAPREEKSTALPRANLRDLPELLRTPTFVVIILESMIVSVGLRSVQSYLFSVTRWSASLPSLGILAPVVTRVGRWGLTPVPGQPTADDLLRPRRDHVRQADRPSRLAGAVGADAADRRRGA